MKKWNAGNFKQWLISNWQHNSHNMHTSQADFKSTTFNCKFTCNYNHKHVHKLVTKWQCSKVQKISGTGFLGRVQCGRFNKVQRAVVLADGAVRHYPQLVGIKQQCKQHIFRILGTADNILYFNCEDMCTQSCTKVKWTIVKDKAIHVLPVY